MSIKKCYSFFLLFTSLIFCSFHILALADNSTRAVNYVVMKNCQGIERIKTTKKVVALTFDDGPHKKYTEEILNILEQNKIRATFFVIGKNAENNPDIIKAVYAGGHVIGNHTYSHFRLPPMSNEEIESELTKTSKIVYKITNKYPIFFRFPYGACSARSAKVASELGFIAVVGNVMISDWAQQITPKEIVNETMEYVHPGAIIGLHDGGGNRKETVNALYTIIRTLKAKGYEFLTIPELLNINAYIVPQSMP